MPAAMSTKGFGDSVLSDSLPPIPKAKHGLVEAGTSIRRSTRSVPCFDDSGLDLRDSLSAASGRPESRVNSAGSPPNLVVKASALPMSPRPQSPLTKVS